MKVLDHLCYVQARTARAWPAASRDNTARLWDVSSGHELAVLRGHEGPVSYPRCSSLDGTRLVTASRDNTARLWNVSSGRELELAATRAQFLPQQFSPDATRLVTTSDDSTARLWGCQLWRRAGYLRGHKGPVYSAVFSETPHA